MLLTITLNIKVNSTNNYVTRFGKNLRMGFSFVKIELDMFDKVLRDLETKTRVSNRKSVSICRTNSFRVFEYNLCSNKEQDLINARKFAF